MSKRPTRPRAAVPARRTRAVTALDLQPLPRTKLPPDLARYFAVCEEKIGFLPNVLAAYSFDATKLRAFIDTYNDLMLGDSGLSKLEREMVAVVVSAANQCHYCLVAHGAAVRQLSGDPVLGEELVTNWRAAPLTERQRAMLQFAHLLTVAPAEVEDEDRAALRAAGFGDRDIWDLAAVTGFFNFSNRLASATDMRPNADYHRLAR
ncbi:MAG: peroxidase-related enzyme [Gammaproteobacteria bacterium]